MESASRRQFLCGPQVDDKYVFEMPYDILIYAIGAETNDFGVPGVKQHTFYFKDPVPGQPPI